MEEMTNVSIPTKLYNEIKKTIGFMRTQSNRSTRTPIMYAVYTDKKTYRTSSYYGGDLKFISTTDGDVFDNVHELLENHPLDEHSEDSVIKKITKYIGETGCDDMEDIWDEFGNELEAMDIGMFYVETTHEPDEIYHNMFFTEDAVRKHIATNKHHYTKPTDFVYPIWRNPEMEKVIKLMEKVGLKPDTYLIQTNENTNDVRYYVAGRVINDKINGCIYGYVGGGEFDDGVVIDGELIQCGEEEDTTDLFMKLDKLMYDGFANDCISLAEESMVEYDHGYSLNGDVVKTNKNIVFGGDEFKHISFGNTYWEK